MPSGQVDDRTEIDQAPVAAEIKTGLQEMKIMDLETIPEETVATLKHQEVSNEEAVAETIGIQKDRSGDQQVVMGI
jgi:hypothetical protein